jgi:diguanylate cyclase (GGDEF)-like protein/PAS domain S-box-containing protein
VLGGLGLVGWHAHDAALLEVHAGWGPIAYNSALSLVAGGSSLLALAVGRRVLALPGGIFVAVLGGLACVETLSGRAMGVDQLFVHAWVVAPGRVPGRMAPNAALGCLLAGVALVASSRGPGGHRAATAGVAGSAVFTLGAVAMFGYANDIPSAYEWGRWTAIAFLAAAGLVALGAGLVCVAWWQLRPNGAVAGWALAPLGAAVLAVVLAVWSAADRASGLGARGSAAASTTGATVLVVLVMGALAAVALSQFRRLRSRNVEVAGYEPDQVDLLRDLADRAGPVRANRSRATEALATSEAKFRSVFEGSSTGMAIVSLDDGDAGRLVEVNPALCALSGYSAEQLGHMSLRDLVHPDDVPAGPFDAGALRAFGASEERQLRRGLRATGEVVWAEVSITELPGGPRQGLVQFDDVSARRAAEEELTQRALYDPLTGLANRRLVMDHLRMGLKQLARARGSVGVLYLDLDHFKHVNDNLGHEAGDEVLRQVGARLARAVRAPDTAGRVGGDEFVIVCAMPEEASLPRVVERVRSALSRPVVLADKPVDVSTSIGVATTRNTSADPDELLRQADTALCEAKCRGRHRWQAYSEAPHDKARQRRSVELDLRRALDQERFELYYQPILDVLEGSIVGAEALLRLAHPDRGLMGPELFLDVAEDSDLIVPIGEWALHRACSQLAEWCPAKGFQLAVNVSGRQLGDLAMGARVLDAVSDAGIEPSRLMLEMTESVLIEGGGSVARELRRVTEAGIGLAIDDFGTGYGSLSYLQRFPVTTVKIDKSFVAGLGLNAPDKAIVEAIAALSRSLGLTTVAEGVETAEQLVAVRSLGCNRAQGFLLGRPMAAEQFAPLVPARGTGPCGARAVE